MTLLVAGVALRAETVTGPEGLLYTVVSEANKTVRVASGNSALFRESEVEITISPTVTVGDVTYDVIGIESEAFANTKITSITIEENPTIKSVPYRCFQNCPSLTTVTLPSTVSSIGSYAFYNCTSLTNFNFHEGLTDIASSSFCGCTSLGEIRFPSSLKSISYAAFQNAKVTAIHWPATIDNASLSLESYSFSGACEMEQLVIPSYIATIPSRCFEKCAIAVVDLSMMGPEAVIGEEAFSNANIPTVIFPQALSSIQDKAFIFSKLQGVVLPAKTVSLGSKVFAFCTSIQNITWPESKPESMGTEIFYQCSSLTSVVLPEWMDEIPSSTFLHCSKLSSVKLNKGLKKIGESAFSSTSALTSIELPDGLSEIGRSAFNSSGLQSINIPASVETIGDEAFSTCQLTSITFAERQSAPSLGSYIFYANRKLTNFEFPAWLINIPESLFSNCNNLSSLENFHPETIGAAAFSWCSKLRIGQLPETVTSIGARAFQKCGEYLATDEYFIDDFILTGNVQIENNAFEEAKIGALTVEACDDYFNDPEQWGSGAVAGMRYLKKVVFPDCMKKIPDGFCKNWTSLEEVILPKDLTALGKDAFYGCRKLKLGDLDLTDAPWANIAEFGDNCLGNTGITSIKWPDNGEGKSFGNGIFKENQSLRIATIPSWMHEVPAYLYQSCSAAKEIVWEQPRDAQPVTIGEYAFSSMNAIENIILPDAEVSLGTGAFYGCTKASFKWPEQPVHLAPLAFWRCAKIEFQSFPEYVTDIPRGCFSGCTSLRHIHTHAGISSIGDHAFSDCTNLETANVLGNISFIAEGTFKGCRKLESITFAQPIEYIGAYAFKNCSSLETINFSTEQSDLKQIQLEAFYGSGLTSFLEHVDPQTKFKSSIFSKSKQLRAAACPTYLWDSSTLFTDCESLQSIEFKYVTGISFIQAQKFHESLNGAPLVGVSTQPVPIEATKVRTYTGGNRAQKGVLMVARGDRWKYAEKGFDKVWDIREYRTPQSTVTGTIHSQFEVGQNRNHYTTYLMWDVNLCDLNPNGETTYRIMRKGNTDTDWTHAATLHIAKPEEVDGVSDLNVQTSAKMIQARISIEEPDGTIRDKESASVDFDFPTAENLYQMAPTNQHGSLYFNPATSRRVGTLEEMGTTSFIMHLDKFDSPDLEGSEGPVPDYYEYKVEASAFDYEEPVNNDNWEVGDDGLAYHMVRMTRPAFSSDVCRVYTPNAMPSLEFNGVYTTEQIEADTDHSLKPSNLFDDKGEITLRYSFHSDVVKHRMQHGGATDYVVKSMTGYRIDDGNREASFSVTSIDRNSPVGSYKTGNVLPNTSYQLVTETTGRGTFGSRVVRVHGAPKLTAEASAMLQIGGTHGHPEKPMTTTIQLTPDLQEMGIEGDNLTEVTHHIGLWRTLTTIPKANTANESADAEEPEQEEVLVHHTDGRQASFADECSLCQERQPGYNAAARTYQDVFAGVIDPNSLNKADYKVRLYVQVPNEPNSWMVAEAPVSTVSKVPVTGIPEIYDGTIPQDALFYNLQGIRVTTPAPGQVVIMVTPRGNRKITYPYTR